MYYTIYQITCKTTNKIYIGKHQTKDLDDGYMGSGVLVTRAQKLYGIENFSKEILHIFQTEEEMNAKEAELVTEDFCLREDTFNLCPGGKGGWGYNNTLEGQKLRQFSYKRWTEAGIKKFKQLYHEDIDFKNKHDEFLKSISSLGAQKVKELYPNGTFYGKKHTDETKDLIREKLKASQTGSGNSQYGTMWITNGIENKKIKKTDPIPESYWKGRKIKV